MLQPWCSLYPFTLFLLYITVLDLIGRFAPPTMKARYPSQKLNTSQHKLLRGFHLDYQLQEWGPLHVKEIMFKHRAVNLLNNWAPVITFLLCNYVFNFLSSRSHLIPQIIFKFINSNSHVIWPITISLIQFHMGHTQNKIEESSLAK